MGISRRAGTRIVVIVALLASAAAAFLTLTPEKVWLPATREFSTSCESGCDSLGTVNLAHLGPVAVYAQPTVDDDIAQWAACLDEVLICLSNGLSGECVARSSCPAVCKTAYARATEAIVDSLEFLFEVQTLFLDEGSTCRPR